MQYIDILLAALAGIVIVVASVYYLISHHKQSEVVVRQYNELSKEIDECKVFDGLLINKSLAFLSRCKRKKYAYMKQDIIRRMKKFKEVHISMP